MHAHAAGQHLRSVRRVAPPLLALGVSAGSIVSGSLFFISFAAIASVSQSPQVILVFYGAVAWIWIWHTIVLGHVLSGTRKARS